MILLFSNFLVLTIFLVYRKQSIFVVASDKKNLTKSNKKTLIIILILNLLIIMQLCFNYFMSAYFIKVFCSIYTCSLLTFELVFVSHLQGSSLDGPDPFCEKTIYVLLKWTLFLAGPHIKLFKSHVNYALMWILRILGPIKFYKGPIKISNGPLKFGNLHVFEWDMGHWPILRAHHHFGLGLTLHLFKFS